MSKQRSTDVLVQAELEMILEITQSSVEDLGLVAVYAHNRCRSIGDHTYWKYTKLNVKDTKKRLISTNVIGTLWTVLSARDVKRFFFFVFTALQYAGRSFRSRRCPSVRLSVRPSQREL